MNWVQEFSSKSRGKKTWRSIFIFLSYRFAATPVPRKLRFAIVSQKIISSSWDQVTNLQTCLWVGALWRKEGEGRLKEAIKRKKRSQDGKKEKKKKI